MKARHLALSLMLVATPALSHDFWIQPNRFQTQPGQPFPVTLQVGHGDARQRWGNGLDRIIQLKSFGPNGARDLKADFRGAASADILTRFNEAGTHAIVLQSTLARSELPAGRFNDYLQVEGLTGINAARVRTGATGQAGRERYSRRAKALVRVGAATPANSRVATRALGLKLEIVLDKDPYTLGSTGSLPLHVVYNGKRLSGAKVSLTNLDSDAKAFATAVTDPAGRANFRVPRSGNWLLNVVWGEPVSGDPTADFETTFSSVTFGYGTRSETR